ncbi:MAG TPA: hypothetical protein VG406_05375 [Isosphaeraceae bacterium]|jgi:hypothetical protein|nr:hypothetical protein [Isosphaeraceae bacterium]
MPQRKPPKRLFKNPDHISSYHLPSRSPMKRMDRMAREHEDVLQNIEFVLMRCFEEDGTIDDRAIDEALRASLGNYEPADPRAQGIIAALRSIRELREDVEEHVWRAALTVVHDSVKRHSELRRGEREYLRFIAEFVE